jgi:hypothetical protein
MATIPMTAEQRQAFSAKACLMQRELTQLVEHLYQNEVPFDDELQSLVTRALDDILRLQLFVRSIDLGAFPITDEAA